MADIPGNSSTSSSIGVGGTVNGTLETVGDHDWFRITLAAGQDISIALSGAGENPLEDPYVYIRNSSGAIIAENDDSGPGRNSLLHFTATTAGTYYIDVAAWTPDPNDPVPDYTGTGTYQLSVDPYVPPVLEVWSNDQIAGQLTSGYWGGDAHAFNVDQGDTLTVNLTALTAAGQTLARNALELWSDIIGVEFREVSIGGNITFDDNEEGAHADAVWSGGVTSSAHVNVDAQWLSDYSTDLRSYSFQTYIHEIGHALGLGHAGEYNGDADYSVDAMYLNDAWSTTVMSYFDQTDNSYFAERGFSNNFVLSPMGADVVAMAGLYGLSTSTRAGSTTYGFNCTADRSIYDATENGALTNPFAYTVIDSGGTDTLDYSGYSASQLINLNWDTFSNVGGDVGNICIARGTVIENAIGGSGSDSLIGNSAINILKGNGGADTLDGRAGSDRMEGGAGNDFYYVDALGDLVIEGAGQGTDRIYASLTFTAAANVEELTLTGSANAYGKGNSLANVITGNGGVNRLYGYDGDDSLYGSAGNDRLQGGDGTNNLYGGTGDDAYYVGASDHIFESAGEGTDGVYATASVTLGANLENLTLNGTAGAFGTGNLLANRIVGNSGANSLTGLDGDDKLYGNGGNDNLKGGAGIDRLYGDAGNDVLDAGTGGDRMYGGLGDDIYYVDARGDYAIESEGQGNDRAMSSVTHTLRAHVEQLTLTGSASINGNGNDGDNFLDGNSGANILAGRGGDDGIDGGAGADVVKGEAGNDWLEGDAGRDRYYGGDGADYFVFRQGDFAGLSTSTSDQIHDFGDAEGDRIRLDSVDANSALSGDQAFHFIGTADFTGTAGELRYQHISIHTYVQGDINGDGAADFWVRLDGLHTLASDDFIF